MPGTKATLFDAFSLANDDEEGSALDRALAGFSRVSPSPLPTTDQELRLGAPSGPSNPIPQGVRDVGGAILGPIFSGERFLNTVLPGDPGTAIRDKIESVPRVGGLAAEVADAFFSPATLTIALRGIALAGQLMKVPVVGGFAGSLVKPILATEGANVLQRLGVEGSAIMGGALVHNVLPENTPFPLQLGLSLLGGVGGASIGTRAIFRPSDAIDMLSTRVHPTGVAAELSALQPGGAAPTDVVLLSALDGGAQELRSAVLDVASTGIEREIPLDIMEMVSHPIRFIQTQLNTDVAQFPDLMATSLREVKPIRSVFGVPYGSNKYMDKVLRAVNPGAGRDPAGWAIATAGHQHAMSGATTLTNIGITVTRAVDNVFGKNMERLVVKSALAPDEASLTSLRANLDTALQEQAVLTKQYEAAGNYSHALTDFGIGDIANIDAPDTSALLARRNELRREVSKLRTAIKVAETTTEVAGERLSKVQRYVRLFREGALAEKPNQPVNRNVLMGLAIENPELFDLSADQVGFLDELQELFAKNLAADNAFGVNVDNPVSGFYVNHATQWKRIKDGNLVDASRDEVMSAFVPPVGRRRSFQFPRTFESLVDWLDTAEGFHSSENWNQRLDRAIAKAQDAGDLEEAARIGDLKNSGLIPVPADQDISATILGRLIESYEARGESFSLLMAKNHGDEALRTVNDLLKTEVNPVVKTLAQAAAIPRSLILRLDASMLGVQYMSSLALNGGVTKALSTGAFNIARTIKSDEEFAKWWMMNADRLSSWAHNGGLVLAPQEINVLNEGTTDIMDNVIFGPAYVGQAPIKDPVTGKDFMLGGGKVTTRGKDINYFGRAVKLMDTVQFARGVAMTKLSTAEHLLSLFKAAGQDDAFFTLVKKGFPSLAKSRKELAAMTERDQMKLIGSYVNDLLGGRDRVALGRSKTHQMIESIFLLTPGFTRGTLHTAIRSLKPGPEGALARDYALRSMVLAGSLVTLMTMATNGIVMKNGKPEVVLPNLTDPTKDDWFDVPLPGGRSIRPMSRFRSLGKVVFGSLQEAVVNGDKAAATQYWTDDMLRWWSYRQSALISSVAGDPIGGVLGEQRGNSFARNVSLAALVTNPSTSRADDIADLFAATGTPISVQTLREELLANGLSPSTLKNIAIGVGSELIGVSQFGPTVLQSQVAGRGAELSIAAGLDPSVANRLSRAGQSPVNAKDSSGRYVLTSDQRKAINQQIATELNVSEEIVSRGGRRSGRERRQVAQAIEQQQITGFFDGVDAAKEDYVATIARLTDAVNRGALTPAQFSEQVTNARIRRAGGVFSAQQANPSAITFLQSGDWRDKQNARDAIFSAISAEAFSEDFLDPNTGTFDFEAQQTLLARLEDKYGQDYYAWQENRDAKKAPLELERDKAFRTLDPYFAIADRVWQSTGLGSSEREFDQLLRQQLISQGVPEQFLGVAISLIKQQIPVIANAHTLTNRLRDGIRILNPDVDEAAVKWLGTLPITP